MLQNCNCSGRGIFLFGFAGQEASGIPPMRDLAGKPDTAFPAGSPAVLNRCVKF